MSMLQDFYNFLTVYFQEGGQANPEELKARMQEEGYEDVTAYDVREAVNLMYDEGDVFTNQQSSALEAYTGGNTVDQSFNGNVGNVNAGGAAAGGAAAGNQATATSTSGGSPAAAPSGGGAPAATHAPPPPPPMDPKDGYSDLDAAVEQIVYVTNITNNTTTNNVTNVDDRDTFEDNDTIVDNTVNQTILANGDVNQTFDQDTISQSGDNSVANTGQIQDSNLVAGDVEDSVLANDISDSQVVGGDNEGIVGDVTGSAVVGDGNETTTLVDSDDNTIGDGNTSVEGSVGVAIGPDAIAAGGDVTGNAIGDGSEATSIDIGGSADGAAIGDGASAVNITGDNNAFGAGANSTEVNAGDIGAIGFGDGDNSAVVDSTVQGSTIQTGGEGNNATSTIDNSEEDNDVTTTTTTTTDNSTNLTQDSSIEVSDDSTVTGSILETSDVSGTAGVDDLGAGGEAPTDDGQALLET